jgi:hypothetical protein
VVECGVDVAWDEKQSADAVMVVICEPARSHRPRGRGQAWEPVSAAKTI